MSYQGFAPDSAEEEEEKEFFLIRLFKAAPENDFILFACIWISIASLVVAGFLLYFLIHAFPFLGAVFGILVLITVASVIIWFVIIT